MLILLQTYLDRMDQQYQSEPAGRWTSNIRRLSSFNEETSPPMKTKQSAQQSQQSQRPMQARHQSHIPCGAGHPSSPIVHLYTSSFPLFYFSLSFIGFTYFLLLSIPSLSTRIVPLCFQAGGRRRRQNLMGLVFVV